MAGRVVVILTKDAFSADWCAEATSRCNATPLIASSIRKADQLIRTEKVPILVVEIGSRGVPRERIVALKREHPDLQIILITPYGAISEAIDLLKMGALAYVCKPPEFEEFEAVLKKACEQVELIERQRNLERMLASRTGFEGIIGQCEQMQRVFETIRQVAPTNATVLFIGESGTGKELMARLLHRLSGREGPFMAISCGALPENLLESELFGHKKGAFSGATTDRIGRFQAAHGGTLFLDEVADIPVNVQAKLLRAIENREIVPLGTNEPVRVDVRLVAATNRDLQKLTEKGLFRRDLYFRLNVVQVELPPLRERRGDIQLLIKHFIREISSDYNRQPPSISHDALKILTLYQWPGNVRELRNCLESMIAVCRTNLLTKDHIPEYIIREIPRSGPDLSRLIGRTLAEIEREVIRATLRMVDGHRAKAAKILGIGERTLYRKIKEYGLRQSWRGRDEKDGDADSSSVHTAHRRKQKAARRPHR